MPATYESIATTTLGSNATEITFSNIAASWTDLRVVFVGRSTSGNQNLGLRLNGSGSGYHFKYYRGYSDGTSNVIDSSASINTWAIPVPNGLDSIRDTNNCLLTYDIFGYAQSINKTILTSYVDYKPSDGFVGRGVGYFANTAAVTSLTLLALSANVIAAGSMATLYGIKAA